MQRTSHLLFRTLSELSLLNLKQTAFISTTAPVRKKKTIFYNRYIKENKPKIYSGFVEEILEKTQRKWLQDTDDPNEPDYEGAVYDEARRRNNAYRHKKATKRFKLPDPVDQKRFSQEQKDHIKFLHKEDPEYFTIGYLAESFGTEDDVIRKILKSRYIAKDYKDSDKNLNTKSKLPAIAINEAIREVTSTDDGINENQTNSFEKKENHKFSSTWFSTFDSVSDEDRYSEDLELITEDMEAEMQNEEEVDEHYRDLFLEEMAIEDFEEVNDNDEEHVNEESGDFSAKTNDEVNFYDNDGSFLYRIH